MFDTTLHVCLLGKPLKMKKIEQKKNKGFTLIELLVVIAIIGILASMIIANLGTARDKARDASIKGSMDSLRASGELYASDNDESYADFCLDTRAGYDSSVGKIADAVVAQGSALKCEDILASWAACAQLRSDDTKAWCVDSEGERREITNSNCTSLSSTDPVCPEEAI